MIKQVIPLLPGAQREEFNFLPFKLPVTHGGVIAVEPTLPVPYDVTVDPVLVQLPTEHGGIVQPPLNFREN